ncbi:hypothetical protein E2562_006412 [Oryza meyeriana var. granulata]|uniref:Uncharacterized protein n=1 Tax=Oryza meyeriana var. granulata TaxID=110450 RepID=A0A6G1EFE1_9ORYZ|nr:hypothetical protein E2562_006412 [Oryza meyeriana var. granulata]
MEVDNNGLAAGEHQADHGADVKPELASVSVSLDQHPWPIYRSTGVGRRVRVINAANRGEGFRSANRACGKWTLHQRTTETPTRHTGQKA